ncbi:5562_t:CDS:1 [Funneliformis mosseae]|uniref:5562_t:CDS:1 n=1 Tax=Funneliformis mosseae TaxID=27381 RepID=A0A9N8V9G0_FUNMO|nr:5562_t:CDS:1 [Funneliformis mosseae]
MIDIDIDDSHEPTNFDILLTDVCGKDLHEKISAKLGIKYLSDSSQEFNDDINGILYGNHYRLFCATTVKIKKKIKIVHFLIDICEDVLNSFGVSSTDPSQKIIARIHNRKFPVIKSPTKSHFSEINVLGMEFMKVYDAELNVYFEKECFSLKFDQVED